MMRKEYTVSQMSITGIWWSLCMGNFSSKWKTSVHLVIL